MADRSHFPAPGTVSRDQAAVMGLDGVGFLYAGSNRYCEQYWDLRMNEFGEHWRRMTQERIARYDDVVPFVSLFAPNKSSALPGLYPIFRPRRHTTVWNWMRNTLPELPGALFVPELEGRNARAMWRDLDSHWSPLGALTALNAVLERFGLPEVTGVSQTPGRIMQFGDLSERWGPQALSAPDVHHLAWEVPPPRIVHDNGDGDISGANTGRHVEWFAPEAAIDARLVIVGNSMCGIGFEQTHLTWWAARTFRQVVFVHSADIPSDALAAYRPDFLLYQTVERFMRTGVSDSRSAAELEELYQERRVSA